MGFYKTDASGRYWNVKQGFFVNKNGEAYNGIEGRILGVRLKEGAYRGQKTEQFQVKIHDDKTGDTAIIAMTAFYHNTNPESPSVPFKMTLQRLIPKKGGPELGKDETIRMETWQYSVQTATGNIDGSCIGIVNSQGKKVEANTSINKESPVAKFRNAVDWLIQKYGTWSGGDTALPVYNGDDDDIPMDEEPPVQQEEDDLPF